MGHMRSDELTCAFSSDRLVCQLIWLISSCTVWIKLALSRAHSSISAKNSASIDCISIRQMSFNISCRPGPALPPAYSLFPKWLMRCDHSASEIVQQVGSLFFNLWPDGFPRIPNFLKRFYRFNRAVCFAFGQVSDQLLAGKFI